MPAYSLLIRPAGLTTYIQPTTECSPTNRERFHSFGVMLSPGNYRRENTGPVSSYALFK